jgi:hypothetical protein
MGMSLVTGKVPLLAAFGSCSREREDEKTMSGSALTVASSRGHRRKLAIGFRCVSEICLAL